MWMHSAWVYPKRLENAFNFFLGFRFGFRCCVSVTQHTGLHANQIHMCIYVYLTTNIGAATTIAAINYFCRRKIGCWRESMKFRHQSDSAIVIRSFIHISFSSLVRSVCFTLPIDGVDWFFYSFLTPCRKSVRKHPDVLNGSRKRIENNAEVWWELKAIQQPSLSSSVSSTKRNSEEIRSPICNHRWCNLMTRRWWQKRCHLPSEKPSPRATNATNESSLNDGRWHISVESVLARSISNLWAVCRSRAYDVHRRESRKLRFKRFLWFRVILVIIAIDRVMRAHTYFRARAFEQTKMDRRKQPRRKAIPGEGDFPEKCFLTVSDAGEART